MRKLKLITTLLTSLALVFGIAHMSWGDTNYNITPAYAAETSQASIASHKSVTFDQAYNSKTIPIIASDLTCSGLELEIRYDETYFQHISSVYSNVSFDESQQEFFTYNCDNPGIIKATYLFKTNKTFKNQELFYFFLSCKDASENVDSYMDIIVGNVIDKDGNKVNVDATGTYLNIRTPKDGNLSSKTIYHFSSLNKKEFYKDEILTYQIACGSGENYSSAELLFEYDRDLFAFDSITYGNQLTNAIKDCNSNVKGAIFLSFVSSKAIESYNYLFTINLKAIGNVNSETEIKTSFKKLTNKLNENITSTSVVDKINILETPIIPVTPKLYLNDIEVPALSEFEISLFIDAKSNLGAADLTLSFDKTSLSYVKNSKETNENVLVGVNETKAKEGIITVSLLSTKGLVNSYKLVNFTFKGLSKDVGTANIALTGKHLTNPQTKPITLDFKGSEITLKEHIHVPGEWKETKKPTYIYDGLKETTCTVCGKHMEEVVPKLLNDEEYKEVEDFAKAFISANVCGTNDNTVAISEIFLAQKDAYDKLSPMAKIALANTKVKANSDNIIEQCLAKYDRIMFLHNKDHADLYPDFMNRVGNVEVIEYAPTSYLEHETIILLDFIYLILTLGLISLGTFLIIKIVNKRRQYK